MTIRFSRMISILIAFTLLVSAVSAGVCEEENEATPSDLPPVEEQYDPDVPEEETEDPDAEAGRVEDGEPSDDDGEEASDSVEVLVTGTIGINQSWEGKMSSKKPAVLKLDLNRGGTVHILVKGKCVWTSVEKTDQLTDNPVRTQTDSETEQAIISLEAEAGSYLITLGPTGSNLLAAARVTVMDTETYQVWEAEQEEKGQDAGNEPESEQESEPEEGDEPADATDEAETEKNIPESDPMPERHITIDVAWDVPEPDIGDTAHLKAVPEGYEKLTYTLQWQYSPDDRNWTDAAGETDDHIDIVLTEENNNYYWRIMVFVQDPEEE